MAPKPRMHAHHIQSNLASLELLGANAARAIQSDVGPALLARIEGAGTEWLPLDVDIALTEAVARATGEEGLRRWSRAALARSVEGPFLQPIVRAAVALFGLTPASLLRHAAAGWRQVYEDCGELRFEQLDDTHVRLHLEHAPAAMTRSPPYLVGTAGSWEAAFDVTRVEGGVVALELPPPGGAGEVVFDVNWPAGPTGTPT